MFGVGLLATPLQAADNTKLLAYIKNNFSDKLHLTNAQLQQLAWVVDHSRHSHDLEMYIAPQNKTIHIEISRALTRLYCLQLLKSGKKADYDNFISSQLNKPLAFSSFKKLSRYIQQLDSSDYALLEQAVILSAVSLSDHAEELAINVLNNNNSRSNSLDFLADTLRADINIYPLISENKLLYILFPPQTNFRHMLYTEGGISMLKYLRTMIQHQYLDQAKMDLWYAYWIVNIAGFRGHVSYAGSVYLNEPVFQAMTKLKKLLDEMIEAPNANPLVAYLEYRADLLGFTNLPQKDKLLLAHLGCLLRLYTIEEGQDLLAGYTKVADEYKKKLHASFYAGLVDYEQPATTHAPALFGNVLHMLGGDIQRTVKLVVPIYSQALFLRKPGEVVSFYDLSAMESVKKIIKP